MLQYNEVTLLEMSEKDIDKLGLLCPKKIMGRINYSGSPSAWTDYDWFNAGHTGEDLLRLVRRIVKEAKETKEYNRIQLKRNHGYYTDNFRSIDARIKVYF